MFFFFFEKNISEYNWKQQQHDLLDAALSHHSAIVQAPVIYHSIHLNTMINKTSFINNLIKIKLKCFNEYIFQIAIFW